MDAAHALHGSQEQSQQLSPSPSSMYSGLSRPLNSNEVELLTQLDRLKQFLATAPSRWSSSAQAPQLHQVQQQQQTHASGINALASVPTSHPALNRFLLPSGEYVSCVLWSGLYHITGTDIVRALVFRFEAFGRPVINMKKFEEGVFSDLRNLKPGTDACLEEPKSPFLDLLFKYQCIRTQKKQKVFYWFSVPHDRLFLDALERDLKREKMGLESTTVPRGEPGISFVYDPKRSLYEQFLKSAPANNGDADGDEEDELKSAVTSPTTASFPNRSKTLSVVSPADIMARKLQAAAHTVKHESPDSTSGSQATGTPLTKKQIFTNMFSLFEGSPTYKQRRKKASSNASSKAHVMGTGAQNGAEVSRRRSTLITEAVSRRNSMLSLNTDPKSSPIHRGQAVDPSSRPQSAVSTTQQLPSYGLSMNPTVERPMTAESLSDTSTENYAQVHPSLQANRPPTHPSLQPPESNQTRTTKAFVCPLFSCRRLFHRAEELKKHLPVHSTSAILRSIEHTGTRLPCDRPGCRKVFTKAETLRLHQQGCNLWNATGEPGYRFEDDEGEMDLELQVQEVEVSADSKFEDEPVSAHDLSTSVSPPPIPGPHRPSDLNLSQLQHRSSFSGQPLEGTISSTAQFAVVTTSAETSPYVETPDASSSQWTSIPPSVSSMVSGQGFAHVQQHPHSLSHHTSHHNIGTLGSPPGSAHSHSSIGVRSIFSQQQGHGNLGPLRYQSPDFSLYPYPSSAPAHKATFDHSSLYPPNYQHSHPNSGMAGLSLRRHRSAAPAMSGGSSAGGLRIGAHHLVDSRPASSAGESTYDYGTVIVNGPVVAAPGTSFAYSVDSGDGHGQTGVMSYVPPNSAAMSGVPADPGSDHSSPMSYGQATYSIEYGDSNSPYDGSNGGNSPRGPAPGHLAMMPTPVPVMHPMHEHPAFAMRGHVHSLSSEIAHQQMQQYVDLDGGAGENEQQSAVSYQEREQPQQYHEEPAQRVHYMHTEPEPPHAGPYQPTGPEREHDEIYRFQNYQHHPAMHQPMQDHPSHHVPQYGYPSTVDQRIPL
ncbi:homeodomain transcription factor ste12 [Serendipita sp. 399]|nr:homeodomain transcription factor ste12 [Serendipita sp. 399]